jgi:hypothetical protein
MVGPTSPATLVILVILSPGLVKLRHEVERDPNSCDLGQFGEVHY